MCKMWSGYYRHVYSKYLKKKTKSKRTLISYVPQKFCSVSRCDPIDYKKEEEIYLFSFES